MIFNLIRAIAVLVIAVASIPGLAFFIIKLQDHTYESWEPVSFKKKWLIASAVCYFFIMIVAVISTASLPLSSKEKLQYTPVQEQLYRRVEP